MVRVTGSILNFWSSSDVSGVAEATFIKFVPERRYSAGVLAVIMCLCVCLSVTCRYCIKTAKRRIMQTTPRDIPGTLKFSDANSSWWATPFPLKFVLKVTRPLSNTTSLTNIRS